MAKTTLSQSLELVQMNGGEPVATTITIAHGVQLEHASVIKLVRQYSDDLQEFGNFRFKIAKSESGAGRPTEYALLKEPQAHPTPHLHAQQRHCPHLQKKPSQSLPSSYATSSTNLKHSPTTSWP